MAKFKAARGKTRKRETKGLIPCLLLVVSGIVLMSLFFWATLQSGP